MVSWVDAELAFVSHLVDTQRPYALKGRFMANIFVHFVSLTVVVCAARCTSISLSRKIEKLNS